MREPISKATALNSSAEEMPRATRVATRRNAACSRAIRRISSRLDDRTTSVSSRSRAAISSASRGGITLSRRRLRTGSGTPAGRTSAPTLTPFSVSGSASPCSSPGLSSSRISRFGAFRARARRREAGGQRGLQVIRTQQDVGQLRGEIGLATAVVRLDVQ
ncbi:hypothetical protein [Streptosporangium vulgare]|uniref:hypothetical protein n=1 Tax=Streptosporangium vulgare TaxID=46190 RepID=UPI003CD0761A